jgi:catalase
MMKIRKRQIEQRMKRFREVCRNSDMKLTHQRDLYESIEKGDFPRWTLKIQVMPEKDACKNWLQVVLK